MHRLIRFIAAGSLVALAPALRAQDMGIDVGKVPPAATVQKLDGKPVALSSYLGKGPVLIEFWATWCPNCRELMPSLLAAEKKYGNRVKVLAVAVNMNQSAERVKKFLAAHPLPHETLWDADGNAADAFDAPATSYVVVLNKKGVVVYTGLGGKQNLDAAIAKAL
jgi:Thiol-disulfide isomerase and thioredoxins